MDTNVQLVLVAVVTSPVLMAIVNTAVRRWEKRGEARDALQAKIEAAKVLVETKKAVEQQKAVTEVIVAKQERAEKVAVEAHANIQDIKNLVANSYDNSAMELLETKQTQLAYLQELVEVKKAAGIQPSLEAQHAEQALRRRIEYLKRTIQAREEEQSLQQDNKRKEDAAKKQREKDDIFRGALRAIEGDGK